MLAGAVLAAIVAPACARGPSPVEESVWQDPHRSCPDRDPDTLRVAVKYTVPLFGFMDEGTGRVEGFDAEMAREVAQRLDRRLVFREAGTDDRERLLQGGCVDVVFSTYSITPERRQVVDFSHVYWTARQVFLVERNGRVPLFTSNAASEVHERVCTTRGSTSEERLRTLLPRVELVTEKHFSDCYKLLSRHIARPADIHPERRGQAPWTVVAVIGDDAILRGYLLEDPNRLKLSGLSGLPLSVEHYGAGLPKGSPLLAEVNQAIDGMKRDGTWLRICKDWIAPVTGTCPEAPPATPAPGS